MSECKDGKLLSHQWPACNPSRFSSVSCPRGAGVARGLASVNRRSQKKHVFLTQENMLVALCCRASLLLSLRSDRSVTWRFLKYPSCGCSLVAVLACRATGLTCAGRRGASPVVEAMMASLQLGIALTDVHRDRAFWTVRIGQHVMTGSQICEMRCVY